MMSTRAERIKTFKYAQITKIKKEEEEPWLSGEELCTEGSSDEETPYKAKLKKIPAKEEKTGKQGAHQTAIFSTSRSTTEKSSESSRTYQRESGKGVITNLSVGGGSAETLIETDEIEVLWRPKRGSLQLPSCAEEQNHLTTCYNEAVKTLQFLKPSNSKHYQNTAENNIDFTFEENEISMLIEDINDFDEKLKEGHLRWKDAQQERRVLEQELRKVLLESSFLWERNSEAFMNICNNEEIASSAAAAETHNKETTENKVSVESSNNLINTTKDFITRNIELAKNGAMATFSLTDEEKSKLETLLSDIDDAEFEQKQHVEILDNAQEREFEDSESDGQEYENGFKFTPNEQKMMEQLETEMEKILDTFPEQLDDKTENKKAFEEDPLVHATESGRLWKFAEMDERIKDIDRQLESLAALNRDQCESEEKPDSDKNNEL